MMCCLLHSSFAPLATFGGKATSIQLIDEANPSSSFIKAKQTMKSEGLQLIAKLNPGMQ